MLACSQPQLDIISPTSTHPRAAKETVGTTNRLAEPTAVPAQGPALST